MQKSERASESDRHHTGVICLLPTGVVVRGGALRPFVCRRAGRCSFRSAGRAGLRCCLPSSTRLLSLSPLRLCEPEASSFLPSTVVTPKPKFTQPSPAQRAQSPQPKPHHTHHSSRVRPASPPARPPFIQPTLPSPSHPSTTSPAMLFSAATALVALAASPVLAAAPHRAQGNKRHAGLAAARRAQAAHAPPARRTVALGKRADGSTCKARHHDAASAAAAVAASSSVVAAPVASSVIASSFQPAATSPVVESSSAPAPTPTSSAEDEPTTTEAAAYVAPTTWAEATSTSSSEAWVAPAATSSVSSSCFPRGRAGAGARAPADARAFPQRRRPGSWQTLGSNKAPAAARKNASPVGLTQRPSLFVSSGRSRACPGPRLKRRLGQEGRPRLAQRRVGPAQGLGRGARQLVVLHLVALEGRLVPRLDGVCSHGTSPSELLTDAISACSR